MNWRAIINYVISTVSLGVAAFVGAAFIGGVPTKDALIAALSAAAAAMIQHVRQNPFKL